MHARMQRAGKIPRHVLLDLLLNVCCSLFLHWLGFFDRGLKCKSSNKKNKKAKKRTYTSFDSLTSFNSKPHFASSSLSETSNWALSTLSFVTICSNCAWINEKRYKKKRKKKDIIKHHKFEMRHWLISRCWKKVARLAAILNCANPRTTYHCIEIASYLRYYNRQNVSNLLFTLLYRATFAFVVLFFLLTLWNHFCYNLK